MRRKSESTSREYIAQFYKGNRLAFFAAMLSALLTSALNLGTAWVLQQMIDSVSGVPGALGLPRLAGCIAGLLAAILALKTASYFSKPRFMEKAMKQYKDYAFRKLTQKSIAAFQTESTADYISAFSNDAAMVENSYLEMRFSIPGNVVMMIGALVMMLLYSPIMTAVACAFFVLPIGVSYLTGNRMKKAETSISEKNSRLIAVLKDALSGFSVVKSFKAESAISNLFEESNAAAEQAKCWKRKLATVISCMAGIAGVTAQLGTFWVGGWLALSGRGITPGILITFIDLTAFVISPIRELPEQLAAGKAARALIAKLADSLKTGMREEGEPLPAALQGGIALKNVSFGYEPDSEVLHELSASFEAGKSYAIVGGSGSGKSTLLNLLMASRRDYSGEICYDGHELRTCGTDSLYDLVSMIRQDVFVFNASIRDNITMFSTFPKEEVERAIALSGLAELIAARGEDYLCGENGNGLSGGEKQRISIARSLLRKSQVLLADEATAALDAETACQVAGSILDLTGMLRVVVTHSLDEALLRRYDCILVMKNGRIVERGRFDELMQRRNYFYSLYTVTQ